MRGTVELHVVAEEHTMPVHPISLHTLAGKPPKWDKRRVPHLPHPPELTLRWPAALTHMPHWLMSPQACDFHARSLSVTSSYTPSCRSLRRAVHTAQVHLHVELGAEHLVADGTSRLAAVDGPVSRQRLAQCERLVALVTRPQTINQQSAWKQPKQLHY